MKSIRSALSLSIAGCLVVLSPGCGAWAAVAHISGAGVSAPTVGLGAAGAAAGSAAITKGTIPVLTLSAAVPAARVAPVPATDATVIIAAQGQLTQTTKSLAESDAKPETVMSRLYDSSKVRPASAPSVDAPASDLSQSRLAKSSKIDEALVSRRPLPPSLRQPGQPGNGLKKKDRGGFARWIVVRTPWAPDLQLPWRERPADWKYRLGRMDRFWTKVTLSGLAVTLFSVLSGHVFLAAAGFAFSLAGGRIMLEANARYHDDAVD